MSEQTEAFRRWLRYADTYVPHLNFWQGPRVDRLIKKAYMAGVKQGNMRKPLTAMTAQDNAKARLQAVCEIYNGMEGFEPKTAPEDYLLRIVRQMYHAAIHEDGK